VQQENRTMKLTNMPETMTDWSQIAPTRVPGASAAARVRAQQAGDVQLRIVEYAPGYLADHWCAKGHVIYVISGALTIEHENNQHPCQLSAGMTWHVADHEQPAHRVRSAPGATVFIVD
jgi:quercetin dioxygenase-like cupin family protein